MRIDETIEVSIPVMGMVYRDATEEEVSNIPTEIQQKESVEDLLNQLNELKAKIEERIYAESTTPLQAGTE